MTRRIFTILLILPMAISAFGQSSTRNWSDWTIKEARQMLDESAWGKTLRGNSLIARQNPNADYLRSSDFGYNNIYDTVFTVRDTDFHYRLLSAKPVRMGFARTIIDRNPSPDPDLKSQLQSFIDRGFDDWIVVSVDYEVKEGRNPVPLKEAFAGATALKLRNRVYLEIDGKKRIPMAQYIAPAEDGLGAKFIFPRRENGVAFIQPGAREMRFYAGISDLIQLEAKYKLKEMIHEGRIEY